MDDADRAEERIENVIADGIARSKRELDRRFIAIGLCLWCESPVGNGVVFCSAECRDDKEHDMLRRKASGL